jgi:hypothetical protein
MLFTELGNVKFAIILEHVTHLISTKHQGASSDDNHSDTEDGHDQTDSNDNQSTDNQSKDNQNKNEQSKDKQSNDNQSNDDWTASFSNDVLVTPL